MESESNSGGAEIHSTQLAKSIDWKQGVIIAMGVPILILPSLYDISLPIWAFSIVIWGVSVIQGFLQNFVIGEMAAALEVPGIGGCAQEIFYNDRTKKYSLGRFLGAFTAWSYWFTWTPVIPIFTIMTGEYLRSFIDALSGINPTIMDLVLGIAIYSMIIIIGRKGLSGGARLGLILALVTLIPIVVISIIPFFNGAFHYDTIVNDFLPDGIRHGSTKWTWSFHEIMVIFGVFAVAQWSACAWESAATYGAEYKDPGKNLPKALIGCGLICFAIYVLVSASMFGSIGIDGVFDAGYATLKPLAVICFGAGVGTWIALFLLIAGMIMLIQTAFLGSSRTLYFMGEEGNLPKWFGKTNEYNVPLRAEFFQFLMGMCLIPLGSPGMILAASSFGFCTALGMAMVCFIKFRREERFAALRAKREYIAPKGWYYVACGLCVYQFCFLIPGCAIFSIDSYGTSSVIIGAVILFLYVPIWLLLQNAQWKNRDKSGEPVAVEEVS